MRRAVVVGGQHGDGRAGLGQAVGVDEVHVRQQPQRPLDHRLRHPPAAVGERTQVRQRLAALLQHVRIRPSMVGTTIAWVICSAAAIVDPDLRREGRQVDGAPAAVDRGQHRRDAGDVVGRHADQRRLVLLGVHELDGRDHVGREVPVAQHRRLRLAGGAAGEQQHGDVAVGVRALAPRGSRGRGRPPRRRCAATIATPATPATRPTMSSSTMATEGAVRASSRRSSASGSR